MRLTVLQQTAKGLPQTISVERWYPGLQLEEEFLAA
jgi:hypothetical protein